MFDTITWSADYQSFGPRKTTNMHSSESLSQGGHAPWPGGAPGGGAGGGTHHMSAQEESAALLKELYAQQLANSQVCCLMANTNINYY